MSRVVVVGAGISGLAAATRLSDRADTTIMDRLPATGGLSGWDDPNVMDLDAVCLKSTVVQILGTTALRWEPGRLLVAAPGSIRWIDADHLVFAGGTRPATAADLRLAGDRPAGVMSATVAEHLVSARVVLGRSALVVGVSHWSSRLAARMHEHGQLVRVVGLEGDIRPEWADAWLGTGIPRAVWGRPRVASIEVERRGGFRERIACDALLLAGPARAIRNIDGAVRPRDDVTFIQELDLHPDDEGIVASARVAADEIVL